TSLEARYEKNVLYFADSRRDACFDDRRVGRCLRDLACEERGVRHPPPPGKWFFRREFTVSGKGPVKLAICSITADNAFVLFVNGKKTGSGNNWKKVYSFDVKAHLRAGKNVLAVEGINGGGAANPAALFVGLRASSSGAKAIEIYSDTQWKSSATEVRGWRDAGFDDSRWQGARAVKWSGWKKAKLIEKIVAATMDPAKRAAAKRALTSKTLVKRTTDKLALARKTLALVEKTVKRPKLAAELATLAKRIEKAFASPDQLTEAMYDELNSLRRRIIFSHPLLGFDRLLINKRPPTGYSHMYVSTWGATVDPDPAWLCWSPGRKNQKKNSFLPASYRSVRCCIRTYLTMPRRSCSRFAITQNATLICARSGCTRSASMVMA
ncbi:MAG: hypothetical protein GY794_09595, partial [bacterium]|nr:hypothetical protein [bacterium]